MILLINPLLLNNPFRLVLGSWLLRENSLIPSQCILSLMTIISTLNDLCLSGLFFFLIFILFEYFPKAYRPNNTNYYCNVTCFVLSCSEMLGKDIYTRIGNSSARFQLKSSSRAWDSSAYFSDKMFIKIESQLLFDIPMLFSVWRHSIAPSYKLLSPCAVSDFCTGWSIASNCRC